MKKYEGAFFLWILAVLFLFPAGAAIGQDAAETSKKTETPAPKSELDTLKAEWEEVREQQIRMIREKEDQLEKLKEEIFAKMKTVNAPAAASQPVSSNTSGPTVSAGDSGGEATKSALQAERQKFFAEMSRQKESLRQLQSALDEKTKQLEAERDRFEQEKKTAAH